MSEAFFDHPILNFSLTRYLVDTGSWTSKGSRPSKSSKRRRAAVHHADPEAEEAEGQDSLKKSSSSSTKARASRPKSSNTTPPRSSTRCAHVEPWRALPIEHWDVTPETARLLQHWRHHEFAGVRPFFCQVEAVETASG